MGDNLAVRDLGVVAYAGIPLVLSDGMAVGCPFGQGYLFARPLPAAELSLTPFAGTA